MNEQKEDIHEQKEDIHERMDGAPIRFIYLRDPSEPDRVVTFAYERANGIVYYSYAVNKVVSSKRIDNKKPKVFDIHCRKTARAITTGRLKAGISRAVPFDKEMLYGSQAILRAIFDHFKENCWKDLAENKTGDKWVGGKKLRGVIYKVLSCIDRYNTPRSRLNCRCFDTME